MEIIFTNLIIFDIVFNDMRKVKLFPVALNKTSIASNNSLEAVVNTVITEIR